MERRDPEEDHLFVTVAWRRIPGAQPLDAVRHQSDLFLAFTACRILRRFAGIEAAGGKLPRVAIERGAILLDQNDAAIISERNEDDRRRMPDDRHFVLAAIGIP